MRTTKFHRVSLLSLFAIVLLIIGFSFAWLIEQHEKQYENYFEMIGTTANSYSNITYENGSSWLIIRWKSTNTWNFLLTANSWETQIRCFEELNWFYINPSWNNLNEIGIVPLSETTLELWQKHLEFENLTLMWGFYTTCISLDWNTINPDAVFWYISYYKDKAQTSTKDWDEEENVNEDVNNKRTTITIDELEGSQYQIQAWLSNEDGEINFSEQLILLGWQIDLSSKWSIIDTQSNWWAVTHGNWDYENPRERYRWSEETRKLEFLPPARSGESVRYTSWIDVYIKIYWITWYVREISGDIMESVTWIFDNYQTRTQITLTEWLWEKTIKYLGYPRDYNESAYRVYEHTYIIELTDLTPPSEWEIKINDNEQFTNNANVTLTLRAEDEWVGMTGGTMRFSCDNSTFSTWENYATNKTWSLTAWSGCTWGDWQKTVYVQFRDAAENGPKLSSASIILDTTNPTCDISISPEHWTNEPITLTIITTEENIKYSFDGIHYSNTKEQQVTANWMYTWYVKDEAWNTWSCPKNVTTRDDIKPVCTVNITKNSLSLIEWDNTWKVTFECIDTWSSIKTMSLISGAIAHTNSVITLSDNAITWNIVDWIAYEFTYTAKAAWSSTFTLHEWKIIDNANNRNISLESNSVVVNANTQSCWEISYSTNSWTNENVIATLPCPEWITITSTGWNTHTFTGNWTFTFTYIDGEGHEWSALADVRWIDKTKPNCWTWTFNPAESGWPTNHDVTATMTWWDWAGESWPTSSSTWCTITNNDYCSVTITDNAWNSTGCTSQRISWIDKTAPTLTQITEIWTTGNRTPDYTFNSSEAWTISYSWSCSGENTQAVAWENTITFNELEIWYHSDCSIIVTDAAWNNSTLNIEPFTINWHNAPTTTLIWWWVHAVPSMWRQDITVDIIRYGWATGGVIITGTNDINAINRQLGYTPVTTWYHTMHIDNEIQNGKYVCAFGTTWWTTKTICSAYPIKIDITSPSLQLTSPTNWQNFNSGDTVTLQWSWYDRLSWISGYTLTITDPDNNTETYYYNSWTTSKTYTINKSWTRQRSVTVNDIVGHGVQKTWTFVIPNSGWNNGSWWGNTLWFNLISPALWDQINLWNNVVLSRHAWTTNNGYIWKIKNISWTVIASWYTTWLTATINSWLFNTWAYSWSVQDIASETTKSIPLFYIVDSQNIPDLKVRQFEFDEITDADTDEYYKSNDITIEWLSNNWYSYAYLKSWIWALYINDRFVWTSGFVKNWDEIFIEMKASDEYNETVKTTLIVWWGTNTVSGDFKITTKDWINGRDSTTLSPMQKLWGIVFIDSLVEMYQYDEEKLATFLSTFMQLLQDKSDYYADMIQEAQDDWDEDLANEYKLYKEAIDFLYTTVKYRYNNLDVEDLSVYIAPNGKQYLVEYNEDRMAYTSPDFARPKYFPTWELFTNHIDMNNPAIWKWWIVWNVITTHNGKVYTIYETNGKWTSSNFKTAKYFDTKEDIINHILANNPASDWNHTVDPDFSQVVYTAPNGKVYKIFKTSSKWNNPNMYSSYNFVNAKYFTSLEAAKKFIDQNNKK